MKQRFVWTVILLGSCLALVSCGGSGTSGGGDDPGSTGGGGSSTGGGSTGQLTTTVEPNQPKQVKIGQAIITFPAGTFGASTAVTLTESTPPSVVQPAFQAIQPALTINYTTTPQLPLTVEYPDNTNQEVPVVAAFDGQTVIGAFSSQRQNGKILVTIDPSQLGQGRSLSSSVISFVLGKVTLIDPPDVGSGLKLISSAGSGSTVIYVHGLLQSVEDDKVKNAARAAQITGQYASAYVFSYDYRLGFRQAGQALATALNSAGFADKSVDIVAYSKGGLLTRVALEEEGATKAVRRVIFLGTPNTGCEIQLQGLYSLLATDFLTNPFPLVFPSWNDNCLAELMPNSSALTQLNQYRFQQNGQVDYWFFNGGNDSVVGINSAEATGLPVGDLTNGRIRQLTLPGFGHLALGTAEATTQAISQADNPVQLIAVSTDPEPAQPEPISGAWEVAVHLTNHTGQMISLETVQLEEFNRYGEWQGNYWYDPGLPPGILFPHQRLVWPPFEGVIDNGETKTLYIEYWPDENKSPVWFAAPERQARSSHLIVAANGVDGRQYALEYVIHLTYDGIYPAEPQTRSRGRSNISVMPMARFR